MPKVWNMTCICCRSVFHLSHYVTKLVRSAAASWVHGVKSLQYGKVTSSLWSMRGQHIIREETKQTAKSPWCWSTPICHLQASAWWTFSVFSGASASWGWTNMRLTICSEPCSVLGLDTVPSGNTLTSFSKVSVLSQGYSLGTVSKCHWILALVSQISDELITLLH